MMTLNCNDTPNSCQRPAPVFMREPLSFSTKKCRGTPKFALPPRAPVKSCPVTRIFTKVNKEENKPLPVSFKNDSDTSFIVHSNVYSAKKSASYFEQCYSIEERLGAGSFGEVFRVRSKDDGKIYACKRTLLKFRGESDRRRRVAEVQKFELLPKHPNCVGFIRAWEEQQHLYLLTELCSRSLADVAEDKHELPECIVWGYLVDLLQGISHLHKHQFVHMDIKPDNIFIGHDGLCKLGDFGLVIDLSNGELKEALEGDPKYLAPECLQGKFTSSVDMFSLGMSLLELATDLDLPKYGEHWHQLRQGHLPLVATGLSSGLQEVLLGLLHPDPQYRLTAKSALDLPIVKKFLYRKKISDGLSRLRGHISVLWLWVMVVLSCVISVPLKWLQSLYWKERPYHQKIDSELSKSRLSEMDLSKISDDECDDHILACPLNLSSSSSDVNLSHHFTTRHNLPSILNSTPIFSRNNLDLTDSPRFVHSYNSSQTSCSPTFFRKRFGETSMTKQSNQSDLSVISNPGINDSAKSSHRTNRTDSLSFNFTSKNLIELFNEAECEEED